MDIQRGNISLWLALSIIILSNGLMAHVIAIPVILNVAGRDSWIAILLAAPLFIGWTYLLFSIIRKLKHRSLIDWLNEHWGKRVTFALKLILFAILFFIALYTIVDTLMWTVTTYLQQTPTIVVSLCMLLLCMVMAYVGLQSIAMVASVLLPIVIFLGYFVATANTKYKDFSLLFPIFDNGMMPVASGAFYVLSALMDIWILLLFAHHMKKTPNKLQILLLACFLMMMVFGPITGAISEFGPTEALKQRHSTFDQWKILSLGQLLQHVDFLSIYQWISGAVIRAAISIYLMIDVFQFKQNKQRLKLLIGSAVILFALLFLNWREDAKLFMLLRYVFPIHFVFVVLFTAAIVITWLIVRRKEKAQHEQTT